MRFTQPLQAAGLLLSLTTLNAEATLISYTSVGEDLVYSSVSDITWTQDANLFKTLYDADNNLISQIATVTSIYNDPHWGIQTIDASDFNTSNGRMTWWGGLAFTNYLNSISYGGSNQWRLPNSNGIFFFDGSAGNELGQLFYSELGGSVNSAIPNNDYFNNEQTFAYWSNTEYAPNSFYPYPGGAWYFVTAGYGYTNAFNKSNQHYAWAVSPGQVTAAVPEPSVIWLLGIGLLGLAGLKRRGRDG